MPLLACCALAAADMAGAAVPRKIGGEILLHRDMKRERRGRDVAAHQAYLRSHGLEAQDLEHEACALYVEAPLARHEIDRLAAAGIRIRLETWVPPVPGHHAHGFYLADVAYDSLTEVETEPVIARLASVEATMEPLNDLGGATIGVDDVHAGNGISAHDGTGVKIAVADSGVDLTHPDLPTPVEAFDVTDGSGVSQWSTNVANTASDHGTHVSGTVLGSGFLSGGKYAGGAPGADFYFYKIGNDVTASASVTDMIEAVQRAQAVGCDIFTMSYGGSDTYFDGSDAMSQAIDAVVTAGMLVFISAGNEANDDEHYSVSVAPDTSSASFAYTISNPSGDSIYDAEESMRVIWRDATPGDANITLTCVNLGAGETMAEDFSGTSVRDTDAKLYTLSPNIAAGASKTYQLQLANTPSAIDTPLVHCYGTVGIGTFDNPDPTYTISRPAVADLAIAVGAWTQRKSWQNFEGSTYSFASYTVGTLAPFSSRGPRIDGAIKPDIVAPGAATISLRDSAPGLTGANSRVIDNDGLNLDGSGPADYIVKSGTSMASPLAAGATALILERAPGLSPLEVWQALTATASHALAPNGEVGYGLIDIVAAATYFDGQVSRFEAASIASPQAVDAAIAVAITALDASDNMAVHFNGSVGLRAWSGTGVVSTVVITELNADTPDAIEFVNVSTQAVDISGWQVHVYDTQSWPDPLPAFVIPGATICPAGDLFTLTEFGSSTASYPGFFTGANINWVISGRAAVLLRDAAGNIVDFAIVSPGNPQEIDQPLPIPTGEWSALPMANVSDGSFSNQRGGNRDRNGDGDWSAAPKGIGSANAGLVIPFAAGAVAVPLLPTNIADFVNGQWSGVVTVQQVRASVYLAIDDGDGHRGESNTFDVQAGGATSSSTTTSTTTSSTTTTGATATTTITTTTTSTTTTAVELVVYSPYGTVSPSGGTSAFDSGTFIEAYVVDSPVTLFDARQMLLLTCTGWVGTGSVPAAGAGTNTGPFSLTQPSSITWLWELTDLVLSNQVETGSVQFEAARRITARAGYHVAPGGHVTLSAGRDIRLEPGFQSATGSLFRAVIEP